jgi:hypothetical protein
MKQHLKCEIKSFPYQNGNHPVVSLLSLSLFSGKFLEIFKIHEHLTSLSLATPSVA